MKHTLRCVRQAAKNPQVAFKGAREFRLSATTHYADPDTLETYDAGRELAHLVTLRKFEVG